jgi:hypothetical protein
MSHRWFDYDEMRAAFEALEAAGEPQTRAQVMEATGLGRFEALKALRCLCVMRLAKETAFASGLWVLRDGEVV